VLRALADPTRRAVVERLAKSPAVVSELAAPFSMALPSLLQHLRVLEDAGVVTSEKHGRVRTDEPAEVATLKGDARFASVLRRAVWSSLVRPTEAVVVPRGVRKWRVPAHEVADIVDDDSLSQVRAFKYRRCRYETPA